MKKLIIALAVGLTAVALNAATATWSLTNITDSEKNTAQAGMLAYFLDASTYSTFTANVTKLANNEMEASAFLSYVTDNKVYESASKVVSGRTGTSINVSQVSGSFSAGDTLAGYIVLFDTDDVSTAEYFAYTTTKSATVNAAGGNIALSYGTFAAGTSGWTAVPEPTSGLLVLLGMAGLALKRKRA